MFIETAKKGNNSLSYYLVGVTAVSLLYFLGGIPLGIALVIANKGNPASPQQFEGLDFEAMGIDLNLGLSLGLFPFILAMLGLWIIVTKIHERSFISIITSAKKVDFSRIFFAAGLWIGLNVLIETTMYFINPEIYVLQFQPVKFFILLLICLFILPIQTSLEELFLRGYLMQGIGMAAHYRIIPLVITSVIFGLLHTMNPEVDKFGFELMMVYYIGFGLAAGIFTLMDEGTELALGLHWGNNFFGAAFLSFDGSALTTHSIFKVTALDPQLMLYVWIPMVLLFTAIMAKKYHWTHWKERLVGKGVKESDEIVTKKYF